MSETYVALYRKYRPQNFKDVVGQEHAVELLTSAIKQKKIFHAYLFCGGRGTGKTTVARIVARDIGCNDEDIIEIDAASNRGIDEIRDLREAVRTAPFSSPYKVYIIDEAHMLTKEAANALLKTLEEPPSHVIFILATTDPDKLPQTIVSRCQKVVFRNPDINTLINHLDKVAKSEGFSFPKDGLGLIAVHGKSSYRDSIGVLEQILTLSNNEKTVRLEKIVNYLGVPERNVLHRLLVSICKKELNIITELIRTFETRNVTPITTYDKLISLVREALFFRINGKNTPSEVDEESKIRELGLEYPLVISSKLVLELLEKRHLLEVSDTHSWAAFEAILLGVVEA
jgi:DNA polymerase-3 subunit gamma/tau